VNKHTHCVNSLYLSSFIFAPNAKSRGNRLSALISDEMFQTCLSFRLRVPDLSLFQCGKISLSARTFTAEVGGNLEYTQVCILNHVHLLFICSCLYIYNYVLIIYQLNLTNQKSAFVPPDRPIYSCMDPKLYIIFIFDGWVHVHKSGFQFQYLTHERPGTMLKDA